jgi:hypothetical protein
MAKPGRHPSMTRSPKSMTWRGSFTGINNDVSNVVVDDGITVARSDEGVFVVTIPAPVAGIKHVDVNVNDTGEVHEVSWATSVANRTLTITHKTCAWADVASAPAAQDVVAQINFAVTVELSDVPGTGL